MRSFFSRPLQGLLRRVDVAHKLVVITAQWPSWLVTLIALGIPCQEAYFPAIYHCYFKTKHSVCTWKTPLELFDNRVDVAAVYLVSGLLQFVRNLRSWVTELGSQRMIVSLEIHWRGSAWKTIRSERGEGSQLLRDMGLRRVSFVDNECGGATDAFHDFGFGCNIKSPVLPQPEMGLPLCERHFLDGGTDVPRSRRRYVPRESVLRINAPARSVLWEGNVLRPDGLWPCYNPNAETYCPAYEMPLSWVVRPLTSAKLLRLYQLPSSMDAVFERHLNLTDGQSRRATERSQGLPKQLSMPFENSPSPVILSSIVRQLWGVEGGVSKATCNAANDSSILLQEGEAAGSVQVTKAHNVEGKKGMQGGRHCPASSIMTVLRPDAPLVDVMDVSREKEGGIQEVKDMEDTSPHPTSSIMTVSRPDSRLIDATDNSRLEEVEIPELEQAEGGLVESPLKARLSESLADGSVTSLA